MVTLTQENLFLCLTSGLHNLTLSDTAHWESQSHTGNIPAFPWKQTPVPKYGLSSSVKTSEQGRNSYMGFIFKHNLLASRNKKKIT